MGMTLYLKHANMHILSNVIWGSNGPSLKHCMYWCLWESNQKIAFHDAINNPIWCPIFCGNVASRRNRKYTAQFKLKVAEFVEQTNNCAAVSEFKIPKKNFRDWRKPSTQLRLGGPVGPLMLSHLTTHRHPCDLRRHFILFIYWSFMYHVQWNI